jgi:ferredoxin-like protein FixX
MKKTKKKGAKFESNIKSNLKSNVICNAKSIIHIGQHKVALVMHKVIEMGTKKILMEEKSKEKFSKTKS